MDLQNALDPGARHVQGYLFSRAEADFQPVDLYKSMLRYEMTKCIEKNIERSASM